MPLPLITPEAMGMTEAEQRQAAAWFLALKAATRKPGIGPTAQHAIQRWAAEESAQEQPLELTVNQLANLEGCSSRSVRRALTALLQERLVAEVKPGVFQLTDRIPKS